MDRRTEPETETPVSEFGLSMADDLPEEYAELDRVENGFAVFGFFRVSDREKPGVLPAVDWVRRGDCPVEALPDEVDGRDRFRVDPNGEPDLVVTTDDGAVGLEYDPRLTELVGELSESVL